MLAGKTWSAFVDTQATPESVNFEGLNGRIIVRQTQLRFEPNDRLHMKISLLNRQIQGEYLGEEDPGVEKEFGWGLSISGRFKTSMEARDSVLFQLSGGTALGRYVRDLRSVGSYDGIFDDQGQLHLFDIVAGYVSYQHWWGSVTRSNVTLGIVDIDNPGFVEGDAYKRTISASANWMWTPTPRVDIGFEFFWGERENEDGNSGNAIQTQLSARYRFNQ
jgi:hypothetical protein